VISAPPPLAKAPGGLSLSRQLGLGVSRIVIDPGHGGHDPGAKQNGVTEADLVLDVALRLEQILLKEGNMDVVLTRRTNVFVPLEERPTMAMREEADLYLSIHANASEDARARGVETYVLNFAQTPQAEAIAARENRGSARTMKNLPELVKAITLNNKIDESRDFARQVQDTLIEGLRKGNRTIRNLGVKQAPFAVLVGADMPSILAEIAFISNKQEGALVKTAVYRQQIAEALAAGVARYQRRLKPSQVARQE
jgi:N-acetylmuramoyl-L-alanine amidase